MQCFGYRSRPLANNQRSARTIEVSERRPIARRLTREVLEPKYQSTLVLIGFEQGIYGIAIL
jgi:hypothetical protein